MFKLLPNNRTFLALGGLSIEWYAIFVVAGAYITYYIAKRQLLKKAFDNTFIDDLFVYTLIAGVIGARIWYVTFFDLGYYLANPIEIIMINNGGIAIHGGLAFGGAFACYYIKKHNYNLIEAANIISPALLIGQSIGRWGNFVNQEAYGATVSRDFLEKWLIPDFIIDKMYISNAYHQPTFFYESIGCILGALIIYMVISKLPKLKPLTIAGFSLLWYGILRYFIESSRTDSLMLGNMKMAQITSIVFILAGVYFIFAFKPKEKTAPDTSTNKPIIDDDKKSIVKPLLMYDLDGTLLDTTELIYQSFIHTFNKYQPEIELTDELLKSFLGPSLIDTFSKHFPENIIDELIECYREHNFANHINFVHAFDGVKDYLSRKKSEGYTNVIITTKLKDTAILGLEITGMNELVSLVIGLQEVTNPKPDPEGILKAMAEFKATKGIYVGDNLTDILAGKNANVCSVGVAWGPKGKEAMEVEADYIINKMDDLDKIINILEDDTNE